MTVIIPTYNRAALLPDAVFSVREQTYPDIELIVVDDGSTDNTTSVVSGFDGLQYIRQAHQGPAAARNHGLKFARGEFIAPLDSDDVWDPDFVARCVVALERIDGDFVFANWRTSQGVPSYFSRWARRRRVDALSQERFEDWHVLTPGTARDLFLRLCLAPSSSLVIRRSAMPGGWNCEMQVADDWYLILEMVLSRPVRVAFTLTPLWSKRMTSDSRYEGESFVTVLRSLYFHDHAQFRRDFRDRLLPPERGRLALRQTGYPIIAYMLSGIRDRLIHG